MSSSRTRVARTIQNDFQMFDSSKKTESQRLLIYNMSPKFADPNGLEIRQWRVTI